VSVLRVGLFQLYPTKASARETDKRLKKNGRWREKGKAGNESSLTKRNGEMGETET